MVFSHEPIVAPGSQTLTFDSKVIPSARFQENNGAAEIVVTSDVPVMASFSNDGRRITIAPPVATSAQAQGQPPAQSGAPALSPPMVIPSSSAATPGSLPVFAVVDASHGGDERGAALTDQLPEKDVTLAFARRLREELMARGLTTMLLRDADVTLTLDQRAEKTNVAGAAIYLCVHAASEGNGVRLYTALMPSAGENHGPFVDWDTAHSPFRGTSLVAASSLASELKNKQIAVRTFSAPLRPLNNVTMAALAIEVGPTSGSVAQLTTPEYQQLIASAVATGIADIRDKLREGQK